MCFFINGKNIQEKKTGKLSICIKNITNRIQSVSVEVVRVWRPPNALFEAPSHVPAYDLLLHALESVFVKKKQF